MRNTIHHLCDFRNLHQNCTNLASSLASSSAISSASSSASSSAISSASSSAKLYIKHEIGDGNCLFRAFARQQRDDAKLYNSVRQEICNYLAIYI